MKNKIALVTCYFQHNYGSQLQAYATQQFFQKLGLKTETIRIDGLKREINKAKYRYFLSKIFDLGTIKDKLATVKKKSAKIFKGGEFVQGIKLREAKFNEFSESKFNLSRIYYSKDELSRNAKLYDAFVVGSDQLWLPSNIEADYYTLNFVPDDICKISYATSFGVSSLPLRQSILASKFLKRLNYISTREKSGVELVSEISGRIATLVCDPTILFSGEQWSSMLALDENRLVKSKYVFCYFLGNNRHHREFVKKIASKRDWRIVQFKHCDEYIGADEKFADYAPYDCGPNEFIKMIRDAEFVFTDSFHCTVFSMLYKKDFFSFRRYSADDSVSTNSRLYNLLELCDCRSRLLSGYENEDEVMISNVNFDRVSERLKSLRDYSSEWIVSCLKKEGIL